MEFSEAVEAAAKATYEEVAAANMPGLPAISWDNQSPSVQHTFREVVLPAVTAAAKVIRNATLDEVDAKFVAWTEREPVGSPEHVMLEAQRNTIAKMKEV